MDRIFTNHKKAECHPDRRHKAFGLCRNCYERNKYAEKPDIHIARAKKHRSEHPDEKREMDRVYRSSNKEKLKLYFRRYTQAHRSEIRAYCKQQRIKLRSDVIRGYGSKCVCCGEIEAVFLEVDHVNGGGAVHRRLKSGDRIYRELRCKGYPQGYQLLCKNCNWAKHMGGCPHQKEEGPNVYEP